MENENKKTPRVIRNLDKSQRRLHFNDRILYCSKEDAAERLEICKKCTSLEDWGCAPTGFFMPRHVRLKGSSCPFGKWTTVYKDGTNNGKDN